MTVVELVVVVELWMVVGLQLLRGNDYNNSVHTMIAYRSRPIVASSSS